jgi:hypothetical protein
MPIIQEQQGGDIRKTMGARFLQIYIRHCKDFEFYSKCIGDLLQDFEERTDTILLILDPYFRAISEASKSRNR